jgi:hypothetical protein
MLQSDFRRIQHELSDWIHIDKWRYPLAVTLTCKKAIKGSDGYLRPVTEEMCRTNLRHVMNALNHRILGSAQSKKQRIPIFPILERNAEGRLHYHAIIDVPQEVGDRFIRELDCIWIWSHIGYRETDVQIAEDQGWVRYILKGRSKPNYLDSIDVDNLVPPIDPPLIAKAGLNTFPTWPQRDPIRAWIRLLQALRTPELDEQCLYKKVIPNL